ncbi:MAG: hypothetical protein KAT48_04040, partial [Bacteroidales bacterium]|nr:hypothetical protein [Bacteroidales bacterium]
MKKIIRILLITIVGGAFLFSCDKETNFESLYEDWDPNKSENYYVQFVNASQSFETGVDLQGNFVNINTKIAIVLLGSPQSTPMDISLEIAPSTTIDPSMYSMSAQSLTIEAGKASASLDFTAYAEEMPVDEWLDLVLVIDAGAHNAPVGDTLKYKLKRIRFCQWTVDEMVGTYTGSETNAYGIPLIGGAKFEVFKKDDNTIQISGFFQSIYGPNYWGETVTAGDRPEFTYKPNGELEFENQWICQTDGVWDYYMGPDPDNTAKWDGCNFEFTIPFYFHWDSD